MEHQGDAHEAQDFTHSNPIYEAFIEWEQTTKDIVDFKRVYVDVAGDPIAGLVLSQIIYWHLPSEIDGETKLRVQKNGKYWIACRRYEWWDQVRVSPKAADKALKLLKRKGIIEKQVFKFNGEPTVHVRLLLENFWKQLSAVVLNPLKNPNLPKHKNGNSPNGNNDIDQIGETFSPNGETPYTETTTQITSENNQQIRRDSHAALSVRSQGEFSSASKREEASEPLPSDALSEAIAKTWNTNAPGMVKSVRKTLLGLHPPGSAHFECNLTPPATVEEILEFKDYYQRQNPDGKLPVAPEKVQHWIHQLRSLIRVNCPCKGYRIPMKIKVPPEHAKSSAKSFHNYLAKYYPEEQNRLRYIVAVLNGKKPQEKEMVIDPTWYGGELVTDIASYHYMTWGDLRKQLSRPGLSQEEHAIVNQLGRIDAERAREIEEIKRKAGQ